MAGKEDIVLEVLRLPALPPDCGLVTLSPDGSRLACVRRVLNTNLVGVWTSTVRPVDLQVVGEEANFPAVSLLCWSPDGKQLAWVSHRGLPPGTNHCLWVAGVESPEPPRMIYRASGIISAVRWSPDGTLLAVADGEAGVAACTVDKGDPVYTDERGMGYPLGSNGMVWIGNQALVYGSVAADAYGLWIAHIGTGERHRVLELETNEIAIPAWAGGETWGTLRGRGGPPEVPRLHIWHSLREFPEIYSLPQMVFDPATSLLPSGDGHLWAFTAWGERERELWVVSVPSGEVWRVDVGGAVDEVFRWIEKSRRLLVSLLPESQEALIEKGQAASEFEFSAVELLYLIGMVGGTGMLGLPDPFLAMTVDEIEETLAATRQVLIDRGFVRLLLDGREEMEPSVATLVKTCAFPEKSLMVIWEGQDEGLKAWCVRLTSSSIVEHKVTSSGKHCLVALADEMLRERLRAVLNLPDERAVDGPTLMLTEEVLSQVRTIGQEKGLKAAIQHLRQAGTDDEASHDLAEALLEPKQYFSLTIVLWREGEAELEEGFGMLAGPSGLWLLRPLGGSQVEVNRSNAEAVVKQVVAALHL
ncbi:MAG TPA: hypothetical protein ENI39_02000 [Anaerolineae bacterium]|nr:hypothetical protein [Anaerolineae bacterium]